MIKGEDSKEAMIEGHDGKEPKIKGEDGKEEWLKLCEQAAVEQDPQKLLALTRQINRLLEERENGLKPPVPRG